jgi:hypothetical protein
MTDPRGLGRILHHDMRDALFGMGDELKRREGRLPEQRFGSTASSSTRAARVPASASAGRRGRIASPTATPRKKATRPGSRGTTAPSSSTPSPARTTPAPPWAGAKVAIERGLGRISSGQALST